jgi:hypothetical protein
MHDLFVRGLVEAFHVRNLESPHGLDRYRQRFVGARMPPQGLSRRPQEAEDLRPIEPLPVTVLAEAHG